MDLYINKCDSIVLTDEELDVIGDAMENFLFTEFFSKRSCGLVVIHVADVDDDGTIYVYRILTARERDFLDYDAKNRFYEALYNQFGKINARLLESEEARDSEVQIGAAANELRLGPNGSIGTMVLLSKLGTIYISFFSEDDRQFSAGCIGLIGLMNVICRLISKRCEVIDELLPELPKVSFYACMEDDAVAVDKIIEYWFKTERESLKQWKATLEAPQ